jgi:hypothetical protein
MTTPQDTLYRIKEEVIRLRKSFYRETEDETYSVFDEIETIRKSNDKIIEDMDILKNTMALILKALNDK